MNEQIAQALKVLVGLRLWDSGRSVDLQWFQFGGPRTVQDRKGALKKVGAYALHIQCAWRIVNATGVVVGSRDRFYPRGNPQQEESGFDWSQPGVSRCDERMTQFLQQQSSHLLVEAIQPNLVGSFSLTLSGGYTLEVFPDDSLESEVWRLFKPYTDIDYLVVTSQGVEV
jgi:hypothetical protein